jgi:hypothetical protein
LLVGVKRPALTERPAVSPRVLPGSWQRKAIGH